jgi:hypothetical protein
MILALLFCSNLAESNMSELLHCCLLFLFDVLVAIALAQCYRYLFWCWKLVFFCLAWWIVDTLSLREETLIDGSVDFRCGE